MLIVNPVAHLLSNETLDESYSIQGDQNCVGVIIYSVRVSVPPKRYTSYSTLVSSIHKTSSCSLDKRCDPSMADVEMESFGFS